MSSKNFKTVVFIMLLLVSLTNGMKLTSTKILSMNTDKKAIKLNKIKTFLKSKIKSTVNSSALNLNKKSSNLNKLNCATSKYEEGNAKLYFSVRNEVVDIQLNGECLLCHIDEPLDDWKITKRVCIDVHDNDELVITGRSYNNPDDLSNTGYAGIIGTIRYNGLAIDTNTEGWICNNEVPITLGDNITDDLRVSSMTEIGHDAKWIWAANPKYGNLVTCSYKFNSTHSNYTNTNTTDSNLDLNTSDYSNYNIYDSYNSTTSELGSDNFMNATYFNSTSNVTLESDGFYSSNYSIPEFKDDQNTDANIIFNSY